jgi:hypothetical protein
MQKRHVVAHHWLIAPPRIRPCRRMCTRGRGTAEPHVTRGLAAAPSHGSPKLPKTTRTGLLHPPRHPFPVDFSRKNVCTGLLHPRAILPEASASSRSRGIERAPRGPTVRTFAAPNDLTRTPGRERGRRTGSTEQRRPRAGFEAAGREEGLAGRCCWEGGRRGSPAPLLHHRRGWAAVAPEDGLRCRQRMGCGAARGWRHLCSACCRHRPAQHLLAPDAVSAAATRDAPGRRRAGEEKLTQGRAARPAAADGRG